MIQSKIRFEKFGKFTGLEVTVEKWEMWEAPSWEMLVFGVKSWNLEENFVLL